MPSSFDPAPTRLDEVIQPAWLTMMLSARWPDAKVHGVTVVETLITQATKVRLALEVTGGTDDIPRNICIKGILTDAQVPGTASVVETRFYREIADKLPVRVPRCLHAGLNDAGDNGVIVMVDEIVAGSTFLSALTPFTVDEARGSLEQLALLHVEGWQGRALYDEPWVPRFLDRIALRPLMPLGMLQHMLDGRNAQPCRQR